MWSYNSTYELYHHGIKGQKWGVRRYQNPDGSLTMIGQKRAIKESYKEAKKKAKRDAKIEKAKAKASSKIEKIKEKYGPKKEEKKVDDMSNDELQNKINRLRIEKEYKNLQPEKSKPVENFIKQAFGDVIVPAAKNIGRQYLEKVLKDKLGLNAGGDDLDSLKREVTKMNLKKQKIGLDEWFNERKKNTQSNVSEKTKKSNPSDFVKSNAKNNSNPTNRRNGEEYVDYLLRTGKIAGLLGPGRG